MLNTPEGHWVRRSDDFVEDPRNWDLAERRSRVRGCGKAVSLPRYASRDVIYITAAIVL